MNKETFAREDALRFLRRNSTAVVATASDGEPSAATVYYVVDDDLNFYFVTKRNTEKNIYAGLCGKVALVVGTGKEHICAQVKGRADVLVGAEKRKAIEGIRNLREKRRIKDWPTKSMSILQGRPSVAIKVVPYDLKFMNLDSSRYERSRSKGYYQIIPQNL